ncbi:uncharacterized protein LOC124274304 isoform X1 [Haliotis rubra]|uniref:uncharacterized protein LOC124274304 isoform X1 n=1 Tax=Haliotis rubra TaxID=36100 RepID=UPI001EE51B8C|nr:uncharacterized protein LOC124274304 isoform X1 [Haliotis rubra]XP_046565609.1 uncharacterized protein LOC124274304 isoform X1 [Haliotis rubra]
MTTPEKPHAKNDPSASAGAAKTGQAHMRRMEYANFLRRADQSHYRGPCWYGTEAPSVRYSGPSYSFGSSYRDLSYSDSPGPCYFPPCPSTLSPGPKSSITSRLGPPTFNMCLPGPCHFPPSPSSQRPGPKFSITSRHMPSRFAITVEEE